MNGFRITILVLLSLAVALLLCMVTVFQNSQREAYETYLTEVKANERKQMIAAHNDRMARIGVQQERGEDAETLLAAQQKQDEEVTRQEERNVLDSAQRQGADREAKEAASEASAPPAIGLVASHNAQWGFIMVKPVSDEPMPRGTLVAIRRGDAIIGEAELGERDEDGQINATLRQDQYTQGKSADKFTPVVGDEIIISPYLSSSELRASSGFGMPALLPQAPADTQPTPAPGGLQEVDAALIPMP